MHIGELPIAAVFADRYLVERRLGQGGMATVYLGRDQKHGRQVAIKVLRPEIAASLGPERFLREISIAAHLAHPHILPLHDSGASTNETGGGGLLWYVMPYVDGESLRDLLTREHQLPIEDALRLTCEVADALDYAHRHNVVHRDIKPENILLEDGHAVVSDFGIARAIRSASEGQLTEAGLALGTPAYMSPEQASGDANLDGRSDLYSLGCVLYEMLAGEPPFTGATAAAIAAKRLSSAPLGVRILRPAVAPEVERALAGALAQVPADRFRTAGELRAALAACAPATAERLASGASGGQTAPASSPRALPRWARAGAIVLAVLVVAAMFVSRVRLHGPSAAPVSPLRTLAILPITNTSGNLDLAYLADGLTDALITELMQVSGLRVISPSSVMRYAGAAGGMSAGATPPMGPMGPPKSLAQIARELRADVVMQASLTRQADTIRVSAALVNPVTRARFWTHGYVRPQSDLFRLQQELAAAVAGALRGSGGPASAGAVATRRMVDPAANESYLKGLYYQAHWKLPEAIAAYEKAVALDSSFAPAYAGMARAYYFMTFFGDMAPAVALGKMEYAAGMALEKDSLLAEAHGQMALVKMLHEWNWPAAERSFRRALELSPGDAQIRHDYAHFLLALGRRHESLEQTEQAVALDPANPMLISCMGWHSLFDKQYQRAIGYASEANQMMPQFWAKIVQGWALLGEGKPDSAVLALREATRLTDNAFAAAALANGLAVTGKTEEARRILSHLLARQEREYVSAYDIASVYAGLREPDEAFKWLRRAADERSTFFVHLGWDARFEGLRKDARYRELIEQRLALPAPGATVAWADVRNGSSNAE
jgi:serine/threonine protein kinase/tetratricopeptide (TPR) repeat protein